MRNKGASFFNDVGTTLCTTPPTVHFDENLYFDQIKSTFTFDPELDLFSTNFSIYEVKHVRLNLKPGKCTLGLINEHLTSITTPIIEIILPKIMNSYFEVGILPPSFLSADIVALLKPGKPQTESDSYRPISILDCLAKFFDKLLANRLIHYLETNNLLSDVQFGGRRFHGCCLQLLRVAEHLNALLQAIGWNSLGNEYFDQYILTALLDARKAYDTISRLNIVVKLHKKGVTGKLLNAFAAYICKRFQCVRVGTTLSSSLETHHGIPQGGISSMLLYLVYVDDTTTVLNNSSLTLSSSTTCLPFGPPMTLTLWLITQLPI